MFFKNALAANDPAENLSVPLTSLRRPPAVIPALTPTTLPRIARVTTDRVRHGAAQTTYRARSLAPEQLNATDIDAWIALEERALEPNAYQSPRFVLPALKHLDPGVKTNVVLIEKHHGGFHELVGAAVVRRCAGSRVMPLPHHEIYFSRYSCLGAPLLDREQAHETVACLIDATKKLVVASAGLVIRKIDGDGELLQAFRAVLQAPHRSIGLVGGQRRALLVPARAGNEGLKLSLRKKVKEIERCKRRIAEQGELEWRVHRHELPARAIDDFLRLEHEGWKGETGTSLRSNPAAEAFFREMAQRFAMQGQALFTELRLDGATIASTSNMVSGHAGFAFKVGWDERFRKYGVGILNETELVRQAPQVCADLDYIDSGSSPESFIEELWPDSRNLVNAFVPTSAWGAASWRVLGRMRAKPCHSNQPESPADRMCSTHDRELANP